MKSKLFFKFFVLAVIAAFVTVTSCKDYDDDIKRLDSDITAIKADYASKIDALKTELNSSIDTKIAAVNTQITALNTQIAALQTKLDAAATKTELEAAITAAKTELLNKLVTLEAYNAFKLSTETQLTALATDLAKAATKEELAGVEAALTTALGEQKSTTDSLALVTTKLGEDYADLLAKHDKDVADLIDSIAVAKSELDLKILALDGRLEVVETLADSLKGVVADQLVLITNNKNEIKAVKDSLAARYAELIQITDDLQQQITDNYEELDGRVSVNEGDITIIKGKLETAEAAIRKINEVTIPALETKLTNKINSVYNTLYEIFDNRVYTLTFIPDYTSTDGTPQIIVRAFKEWEGPKYTPATGTATKEAWNVKTAGKVYKGITVLKYNVSPANVALSDFDVLGLVQKVSLVRSSGDDFLVLVDEATLTNGVLSVPVAIASDSYTASTTSGLGTGDYNKNVSVALQVNNLNADEADENDRVVTSTEYVKVNYDLSAASVALTAESEKADKTILPTEAIYSTIALDTYPADVKLWNGKKNDGTADVVDYTIDLKDYVQGVFHNYTDEVFKMLDYGFNKHVFKFRLVNLPNEGVDQSARYVSLDADGVIGVIANANGQVNQAAAGRTPVVEATLLVDGVVHAVGYIKILITNNYDVTPITDLPVIALDPYTIDCNSEYIFTDGNKLKADMDKIFNHTRVMLGKDQFFNEYTGITHAIKTFVPVVAGTPADADDFDFDYATYQDTQSGLQENYIEGSVSNTAPAGVYTIETTLTSNGYRPAIILTWTITVNLPTYSLTANTTYLTSEGFIINPSILQQGAKTSAVYEGLLNQAFVQSGNVMTFTPLAACEDMINPYFIFKTVPTGYNISADGLTAYYGPVADNVVAARIIEDGGYWYIRLNDQTVVDITGSRGNYVPFSNGSKGLVGKSVTVEARAFINGVEENNIKLYNAFKVVFIEPLRFELPEGLSVYDKGINGNNQVTVNLYNPNILVDHLDQYLDVTTTAGRNLINHYEVAYTITSGTWHNIPYTTYATPFVFDKVNLKTNLNPATGLIEEDNFYPIQPGTLQKIEIEPTGGTTNVIYGNLGYSSPAQLKFIWENTNTAQTQNGFKVAIPVTVNHKWGVLKSDLIISVLPGSGN